MGSSWVFASLLATLLQAAPGDAERLAEPASNANANATEAPGGRLEEWRKRREARMGLARLYAPNSLERLMLKSDKGELPHIYEWNLWGFYPRLQNIAAGSSLAPGVRYWRPDMGGSPLSLHGSAFYSFNSYQYYDAQLGVIPHPGRALPLRATNGDDLYELADIGQTVSKGPIFFGSFKYRDYTELTFYGTGAEASADQRSSFRQRDVSADLVAGYQFARPMALTLRVGSFQPEVSEGQNSLYPTTQELFDDDTAPGLSDQPDFLTLKAQAFIDVRDVLGAAHKGVLLAIEYSRFDDRNLDQHSFDRWAVDARGYLPLGSVQRTLALRAWANIDDPGEGQSVPFYLQETLGGPRTLRGFENFRFRGEKVLLLQAEYRWAPSPAVEMALFVDSGTVSDPGEDLDLDTLKTNWGVGLRFKSFRSVILRFEFATGDEGGRFVFDTRGIF